MRFITSVSPCAHSRTTNSHVLVVVQRPISTLREQSTPSSLSCSRTTKSSRGAKMACRSSTRSRTKGIPHSPVCDLVRISRLNPTGIKRPMLSTMTCACIGKLRVFHTNIPAAETSGRKWFGTDVRTCSSAASTVKSSIGSLVFRSPSAVMAANNLNHSNAPQKSEEWFALRRDKLTTSTFSTALGFWKGKRRYELWHEKVFPPEAESFAAAARAAMDWGVVNESNAVERYKSITGRDVESLGFATHAEEKFQWLGASPDGLLGSYPGGGILEVKCPFNKGKPERGLPWSTVPFYYIPQVQGLMEILDREWADLYCWTPNGSSIFRVPREREYWSLMNGILHEFWWSNVIPARELLLLGKEEDVKAYEPTSTHKLTGLAIVKSMNLAGASKLVCKEIAGHVEYFR